MNESDLNSLNKTSITKTHEEILEIIEEIKEFEKKYGEFETEDSIIGNELSELEYVTFEEIEPDLVIFKEIEEKKTDIINNKRKFKINFGKKRIKEEPDKIEKPISPTTFRLRINKEGILENIDIKKPKPRKKIKISLGKKDKEESENTEGKSKIAKLINGLSKIKRIIPKRGKEEDIETEETETSDVIE